MRSSLPPLARLSAAMLSLVLVVAGGCATGPGQSPTPLPATPTPGPTPTMEPTPSTEPSPTTAPVTPTPLPSVAWVEQAYLKAAIPRAEDGFGGAVAASGDTLVVGAHWVDGGARTVGDESDASAPDAGAAYVFVRGADGEWTQQAYLQASSADANDWFGWAVAISGDTIVVGAPWEGSRATGVNGDETNNRLRESGAAYVFVRDAAGNWAQQAYLKASNTGYRDWFGWAVAIDGDTIVVGAHGEDSRARRVDGNQADHSARNAGAAYVFTRDGAGEWAQQAYLKASDAAAGDHFGRAVAIEGNSIIVGAAWSETVGGSNTGSAYIFTRGDGAWLEEAVLVTPDGITHGWFGWAVAISGDTAVIGAPDADGPENYTGAAYVFARVGSEWQPAAVLHASNAETHDGFGGAVAINGSTIVVAASQEDSSATGVDGDETDNSADGAGAAYVFTADSSAWPQTAYLKASNASAASLFGRTVAIDGDTIVVGAEYEDGSAVDSGAAYIFVRG